MLIKFTSMINDRPVLVNIEKILNIEEYVDYTLIRFSDGKNCYIGKVKETAEEILEIQKKYYKGELL